MGRGRLSMEPIEKERARKATFQKRRKGLIKKAYEFSTLCGVDAALIIYGPDIDDQPSQPVTWPQDPNEVLRIIEKYNTKLAERRPKNYDVEEFFKDRKNRVEAEISKVRKETLKIMYPTWDERFNALGEEQLRLLVAMLDAKLAECDQRINMMKRNDYLKGKAIESDMAVAPYLASNRSHLNFMHDISPLKPLGENNQETFYPFHLDKSFQSRMLPSFDQNYMHWAKNGMVGWTDQVGAVNYFHPKTDLPEENVVESSLNSSLSYNNGSVKRMQPLRHYPALQRTPSLPSYQNMQQEAAFDTHPSLPPGFQTNDYNYYDILQVHVNKCMNAK